MLVTLLPVSPRYSNGTGGPRSGRRRVATRVRAKIERFLFSERKQKSLSLVPCAVFKPAAGALRRLNKIFPGPGGCGSFIPLHAHLHSHGFVTVEVVAYDCAIFLSSREVESTRITSGTCLYLVNALLEFLSLVNPLLGRGRRRVRRRPGLLSERSLDTGR